MTTRHLHRRGTLRHRPGPAGGPALVAQDQAEQHGTLLNGTEDDDGQVYPTASPSPTSSRTSTATPTPTPTATSSG